MSDSTACELNELTCSLEQHALHGTGASRSCRAVMLVCVFVCAMEATLTNVQLDTACASRPYRAVMLVCAMLMVLQAHGAQGPQYT